MKPPSPTLVSEAFPRTGSSLYYALAAAPTAHRRVLSLWLQWWHQTAQIPLIISDPGVAETKLRWWQQEVNKASQGQASHPVLKELMEASAASQACQLPAWSNWQSQLDELITLIHQTRWLDEASLIRHAQRSTGLACEGAAVILGLDDEAALSVARQIGCGLRQAHFLARLGQDARAGWVNVGIDVLQQHDVRAHQLSKPVAGQTPDGWAGLLLHLQNRASSTLTEACHAARALPRPQRQALKPLLVLAQIQLRQVAEIARHGDLVLHERIVLTPIRKWWIGQRVIWGLLH